MNCQEEIIKITSEYFKDTIEYLNLSDATKKYKAILNSLAEQDMNIKDGRDDIHFENGKALGTFWAALCLDDILRTRQFIRGIDKAIKDAIKQNKKIHILYAGTGPFATLILPLILRYSKENVKYTLLEINPLSFNILQKVISKLGLEKHNITFVNEDATKYKIDPKNEPNIIISETLQNSLAKEQQVPIFLNLMSQVSKEVIFIPEKIELSIGVIDPQIPIEKANIINYHKKASVFEVSKASMFHYHNSKPELQKEAFEKKRFIIEKDDFKNFNHFLMFTELQVYKDEKINLNQSGLTTPMFMESIPHNLKEPITIDTQYIISSEPKLDYKIIFPN